MAIEFNCPYCTAPIRVPDSAGGKRGTCPRCKTGILVPKVKTKSRFKRGKKKPEAQPEPEPGPAEEKPQPAKRAKKASLRERFGNEPDFTNFGETAPVEEPAAVSTQPAPPPVTQTASVPPPPPPGAAPVVTPITRSLRRRKRGSLLWVPILFGAMLVGGVALFFLLQKTTSLDGELEAKIVDRAVLKSRHVPASSIDVDKDKLARVLEHLEEHPGRGGRFIVTATSAGLAIQPNATDKTDVYEVNIAGRKALQAYFEDHAERLAGYRRREYERGMSEFFEKAGEDLETSSEIRGDVLQRFQRRVLANALIDAKGYHLVASINGQGYHCVFQSGNRLYYLLPKGTKNFRLRGRNLPDGGESVPAKYFVNVAGEGESAGEKSADE